MPLATATRRGVAAGLLALPAGLLGTGRPASAQQNPPLPTNVPALDRARAGLLRTLCTSTGFREALAGTPTPPAAPPVTTYAADVAHARRVQSQVLAVIARAQTAAQRAQIIAASDYADGFRGMRLDPRLPFVASGTDLADVLAMALQLLLGVATDAPRDPAIENDPVPAFARVRAQVLAGYASAPPLVALSEGERREWAIWMMTNASFALFTMMGELFAPAGQGPPPAVLQMQTRTRTLLRDAGLDPARVTMTPGGLRMRA